MLEVGFDLLLGFASLKSTMLFDRIPEAMNIYLDLVVFPPSKLLACFAKKK